MRLTETINTSTPTTATLQLIPSGKEGIKATLKLMGALVKDGKKNLAVRQTALSLVQDNGQKDWVSEVKNLFDFVQNSIRYVKDIRGVETLQTPDKTLEFKQGDCDDKSTLLAALLESIGHPTAFAAISLNKDPENYVHVYVLTKIGADWVPLETTEPVPMGWYPPNQENRIIFFN